MTVKRIVWISVMVLMALILFRHSLLAFAFLALILLILNYIIPFKQWPMGVFTGFGSITFITVLFSFGGIASFFLYLIMQAPLLPFTSIKTPNIFFETHQSFGSPTLFGWVLSFVFVFLFFYLLGYGIEKIKKSSTMPNLTEIPRNRQITFYIVILLFLIIALVAAFVLDKTNYLNTNYVEFSADYSYDTIYDNSYSDNRYDDYLSVDNPYIENLSVG